MIQQNEKLQRKKEKNQVIFPLITIQPVFSQSYTGKFIGYKMSSGYLFVKSPLSN